MLRVFDDIMCIYSLFTGRGVGEQGNGGGMATRFIIH